MIKQTQTQIASKKININPDYRLNKIKLMALVIQDNRIKRISQIRRIAHEIEIMANTKLLKQLNQSLNDYKKGKFITLEEFNKKCQK